MFLPDPEAGAENVKYYFYSSETNINNYKSLKMEFDLYLSRFGSDKFQPFDSRKAFEKEIRGREESLFFMSSWHYANICEEYGLSPILVGVRNGKTRQKRILVSRKSVDLQTAKTGRVASASSVVHTKRVLGEIFGNSASARPSNILIVPKDIDALMSVCFSMSSLSALTTENSFDRIRKTNSNLVANIDILAQTRDSLLLIICASQSSGDVEKKSGIILDMASDPVGGNLIKMMGLDGWQKITSTDRKYLAK